MNTKLLRTTLAIMTITFTWLLATPALASSCKGLKSSACSSKSSCSWVEGYTRKDGAKVKSFCRKKPGSKTTSKAAKKTSKDANASTKAKKKASKEIKKLKKETKKTSKKTVKKTTKKTSKDSKKSSKDSKK